MITARRYGSVIATLGVSDHGGAKLMLRTIERALRDTPAGDDRAVLEQWRKDVVGMLDRAHREKWPGWERA